MQMTMIILGQELRIMAKSPVLLALLGAYAAVSAFFAFGIFAIFRQSDADLRALWLAQPWLLAALASYCGAQMWTARSARGLTDFLFASPVPIMAWVWGRFMAATVVGSIALGLTTPIWLAINVLGQPDNIATLTTYLAYFWVYLAYLALAGALTSLLSARLRHEMSCFTANFIVLSGLCLLGSSPVQATLAAWWGEDLARNIASLSPLFFQTELQLGVLSGQFVVLCAIMIGVFLALSGITLASRKGGGA